MQARSHGAWGLLVMVLCLLAPNWSLARELPIGNQHERLPNSQSSTPAYGVAAHWTGNLILSVTNEGCFGSGFSSTGSIDFFTGDPVPSCEYPADSDAEYLYVGALWIGAVVGRDTLVSEGADGWRYGRELAPDEAPAGYPERRMPPDPGAVSDYDLIGGCTDTLVFGVDPDWTGRPHLPLNIEVTQTSYSWSVARADDIVLMDYQIKNIGSHSLQNVYLGIYVDGDAYHSSEGSAGAQDDLTGFIRTCYMEYYDCARIGTLDLAWTADNDGQLDSPHHVPHATGLRILESPALQDHFSFNWWVSSSDASYDFGPRERPFKGLWKEDFRNFGTGGLGTPEGDANKYYMLRNREIDYDQVFTRSIRATDSLWLQPPQSIANDITRGRDTRYLMSVGPLDIAPGESVPLVAAFVAGKNLHTDPANYQQNLPDHPDLYYSGLDFSGLIASAWMATWTYDNPGVDTDGDGYRGESFLCEGDTVWMAGDGISDFQVPAGLGGCCEGTRGNIDGDGGEAIDIHDLTYFVDFFFRYGEALPCLPEADVNADLEINIIDLTFLVAFLFAEGDSPVDCL